MITIMTFMISLLAAYADRLNMYFLSMTPKHFCNFDDLYLLGLKNITLFENVP